MNSTTIFKQISDHRIVPVVALESLEAALPLADTLSAGDLPLVEITFRTQAAPDVIRRLTQERPQLLVGAGTVLTPQNLQDAHACGARFAVAPGLNPDIVRQAHDLGLPFIPGVITPSEIERALALGCTLLKFFPAEPFGGVKMLEALFGPFAHTGLRFMPTGGVNADNLQAYLSCKPVAAVGGTWLAKKEDIAAAKWDQIRERCQAAVNIVRRART